MTGSRSTLAWGIGLTALLCATAWAAAGISSQSGELVLDLGWPSTITGDGNPLDRKILLFWKLPRVLTAVLVGALLAVAGLVLQGLTRNPLADPYLLGISGGAGLAVVLLHALPGLVGESGWWLTPMGAFIGAQGAALLVLALGRSGGGRLTVLGLILAGVIVNAFCAAAMTFLLVRFDPFRLRVTTLWLAGGIGFVPWHQLGLVAVVGLVAWVYLRAEAHRLNAFALGDAGAASVGVETQRLLLRAALVSSLLTGIGVSLAGLLGYVGLIVPHVVRRLVGSDFRRTLPLTMIAGALLLVLADTAARTLLAPEELPVGVLTAILGAPILLILLKAQLRGRRA